MLPQVGGGILGGLLGGIAGSQPDEMKSSSWVDVGKSTAREDQALNRENNLFDSLFKLVHMGPGEEAVSGSLGATNDFAAMLKEMMGTGGLPSQGDIDTSEGLAGSLFGRRRTALQQSFEDASTDTSRLSAMLGREVNDPILQAKLRTGMMRETALLDADQSAWATDYATKLPERRLGFASQRADVMGNLARQAMNNRSALLGIGSNIAANERSWRLQTGKQHSNQETGGGLKGFVGGAMAGAGMGASIGNAFAGAGGGSGGGSNPFAGFNMSSGAQAGSAYSGADFASAFSGLGMA